MRCVKRMEENLAERHASVFKIMKQRQSIQTKIKFHSPEDVLSLDGMFHSA